MANGFQVVRKVALGENCFFEQLLFPEKPEPCLISVEI
jgi:hypothetical protein